MYAFEKEQGDLRDRTTFSIRKFYLTQSNLLYYNHLFHCLIKSYVPIAHYFTFVYGSSS